MRAPTLADCIAVGEWRQDEDVRLGLRTNLMLTDHNQARFWEDVASNPRSPHRYWAVYDGGSFVAFTGLTDLDWQAGNGEISLLVNPNLTGQGYGESVVALVLREAFERMRLRHVFGECYDHNPAIGFWRRMLAEHGGDSTWIPGRKFWGGELHGAMVFWFGGQP